MIKKLVINILLITVTAACQPLAINDLPDSTAPAVPDATPIPSTPLFLRQRWCLLLSCQRRQLPPALPLTPRQQPSWKRLSLSIYPDHL